MHRLSAFTLLAALSAAGTATATPAEHSHCETVLRHAIMH